MIRRTFTGYKPSARIDGTPWTGAFIQESGSYNGPWVNIQTIALTPLDTNPASPAARSMQTDNAVLEAGWYRIVFFDADGDTDDPTSPVGAAAATGFTAAMIRKLFPSVDFATLGYPLVDGTADPLVDLVAEAVGYLANVTGRDPLQTIPNDFPGGPAAYLAIARRAVAQRVVQLVYGFTGDNLTAGASGVQSFAVPGYSETKKASSAGQNASITNAWDSLWENIWLLMTPEKREEWEAARRGEDVPFLDIVDVDVAGAGLSDPYWGVW